jgi:formate/nitrite transporter FocA (FNT family)
MGNTSTQLTRPPADTRGTNLVSVTLGNIGGGGGVLTYWIAYRKDQDD